MVHGTADPSRRSGSSGPSRSPGTSGFTRLAFGLEHVGPEVARPLRHEVLRAGLTRDSAIFPGDEDPMALHVAVRVVGDGAAEDVVSVGMTYPDPPPWEETAERAWRIRGMATRDGLRGRGLGRMVLDALVSHASEHDGSMTWCHARFGAVNFYLRAGFSSVGGAFDDGIALHQSMWRPLA
ncbi:MAG: GNAT family N-acetyltransferase [Acidimicrobiales bacterium]